MPYASPSLFEPLLNKEVSRDAHCKEKVLIFISLLIGLGLVVVPGICWQGGQHSVVRQRVISMPGKYVSPVRAEPIVQPAKTRLLPKPKDKPSPFPATSEAGKEMPSTLPALTSSTVPGGNFRAGKVYYWDRRMFKDLDEKFDQLNGFLSSTDGQPDGQFTPVLLNEIIVVMWPDISEFVIDLIQNYLEPEIQKALGSLGESFSFDKQRCQLGSQPARFRNASASKVIRTTEYGEMTNLVLRGDLEWQGDPLIYMIFGRAEAGIHNVILRGELVVELVGMKSEPVFYDGLRVYFVDSPDVDLGFLGNTNDVLQSLIPDDLLLTIKSKILEVVAEGVANTVVVPNSWGLKWDENAEYFQAMKPPPEGVLTLGIKRAKGLRSMDSEFFRAAEFKMMSDAYVAGRCGAQQFRSQAAADPVNPFFDVEISLPIASAMHQRIHLGLFREVLLGNKNHGLLALEQDELLGQLDLRVAEMLSWGEGDHPLDLSSAAGYAGQSGKIWLSANWRPFLLDARAQHTDDVALVSIGVYSASYVPLQAPDAQFWVTARCSEKEFNSASRKSPPQNTHKVEQGPAYEMPTQEQTQLKRLDLLQAYRFSPSEIAEIMDLDLVELQKLKARAWLQKNVRLDEETYSKTQTLHWDHAFEFFIERASKARITLELNKITSLETKGLLGKYSFAVSELMQSPRCTETRNVQLPGTNVSLKLRLQVRFLAMPRREGDRGTWPPWGILGDPLKEIGNLQETLGESLGKIGGSLGLGGNQSAANATGTSTIIASENATTPKKRSLRRVVWGTVSGAVQNTVSGVQGFFNKQNSTSKKNLTSKGNLTQNDRMTQKKLSSRVNEGK